MLQVRTRAGAEDAEYEVSYPVQVYVFKGETCVALQTISSEGETLSIPLVEGTYSVFAVGGADTERYVLPSQAEATPQMAIALRDGKRQGDLMVAKSSVVLVDGGTNTLTLTLERKVMLLQSVVLKKIPATATAVSVTISPLREQLVGTGYVGESGTATVSLTKQADGSTWQFVGEEYLLPPAENPAAIAVNIVKPEGTSSYTYNTADQLEAGYKINIEGTYTEAVGVTLTGTIVGAKWEERTISFEFNESGTQTTEDDNSNDDPEDDPSNIQTGNIPAVGDTYLGCYVLAVSEVSEGADVLLLSPTQKEAGLVDKEEQTSAWAKVEALLPECSVDGIDGWHVMTREEATIFHTVNKNSSLERIPNRDGTNRYLLDDAGTLNAVKMGSGDFRPTNNLSSTDILRPVATVRILSE